MSNRNRDGLTDREALQMARELGLTEDSIGVDEYGDAADDVGVGGTGVVEISDRPTHILDFAGAHKQIVDEEVDNRPFKDDWDALVEQKERAKVGPNGERLDDFDSKFQEQGAANQALQDQAPFTRNNPPSAANAILGSTVVATAGGPLQQAAFWQADNDVETTSFTVTLGAAFVGLPPAATFANYRPYAVINFGTRGFAVAVTVDIATYTQITLSGSMCNVAVGIAPAKAGVTTPSSPLSLTGMISFTPGNKAIPPFCTLYVDSLAQGASTTVAVPNFARYLTVYRDPLSADFTLFFLQGSGGGNYYTVPVAANTLMTNKIPIGGDIYAIIVTNGVAAPIDAMELIFELGV